MKKKPALIPLLNFFAETLRETLEESSLSQAEIARRCGIPAPHLTQMKQGKRRCTPEYDLRLSCFLESPRPVDESPSSITNSCGRSGKKAPRSARKSGPARRVSTWIATPLIAVIHEPCAKSPLNRLFPQAVPF